MGKHYILHVLSDHGKTDLAYRLLFNEGNPSWLYSINHGATTIREHWNGIKEDGNFWSSEMNSFNHYAYGAVGNWLYTVAAGIKATAPAYQSVTLAPMPDRRLGHVDCRLDTRLGRLESHWYYKKNEIYFEFLIPAGVDAKIILPNGTTYNLRGGTYHFVVKE